MTLKLDFYRNIAGQSLHPCVLFIVFIVGVTSVIWRFGPWLPDVFFGDDLANFLAYKDGHFPTGVKEAFSVTYVEKYRPLFHWIMSAMFGAFDDSILTYLALNILLHGVNATIIFAIAHRLSHGNWMVSLAVALAVATSRFALYQVTQVTGLLEGIALTLFLLMIYSMVRASESKEAALGWSWLAVIAAFLAIHTHERYIVVAVWLGLAMLVLPNFSRLQRTPLFILLGACVAIVLFNVILKTIVLEIPFLVGTSATHFDLNVLRVLEHAKQALLSIFGFNEGPEYLIGARTFSLKEFPIWLLAAAFTLAWFVVIVTGVRAALIGKVTTSASHYQPLIWPLLLIALGVFMLVPPALTIRMEQRWILQPFIVTLLLFAWAAGVKRHRTILPMGILALAIAPGLVVADSFIATHFGQIFFVSSGRFATAAKRDIVDKDYRELTPVVLVANSDHCNWTLLRGEFFRLYGGTQRTLSCFGSVGEVNSAVLPESARIYSSSYNPLNLTDITSELRALSLSRGKKVTHDLLALYPEGRINDTTKVSSPTGSGAMIIPWESFLGLQNTLTVISGFSYSYDAVTIERDADLRFGITMVYPSRESARAIVRIKEEGAESRILYSQDLKPPSIGEKLLFETVIIPLGDFAKKKVSLTFIVETPPGKDNSGHWVAFSDPRIVLDITQ